MLFKNNTQDTTRPVESVRQKNTLSLAIYLTINYTKHTLYAQVVLVVPHGHHVLVLEAGAAQPAPTRSTAGLVLYGRKLSGRAVSVLERYGSELWTAFLILS